MAKTTLSDNEEIYRKACSDAIVNELADTDEQLRLEALKTKLGLDEATASNIYKHV